jgi:ubiquinone/menaquinone biosynthesis C-methylase UbiE
MLTRELEPEIMDSVEAATDYDVMDHTQVNARFVEDFADANPTARRILDVGTGTALIPILLCARLADVCVRAVDLSDQMLDLARANVARVALGHRITIEKGDAKAVGFEGRSFDSVISNSLVHHIPEPSRALAEMWRLVAENGVLFVRDLVRPDSESSVARLVEQVSPAPPADGDARARYDRQVHAFAASLRAALTLDEVRALVTSLNLAAARVERTSDRHWTLVARRRERSEIAPQ